MELGQPTLRTLSTQWLTKLRSLFGRRQSKTFSIIGSGGIAFGGVGLSARGFSVDRSSIESRVAALESSLQSLREDVGRDVTDIRSRVDRCLRGWRLSGRFERRKPVT